MRFKKPKFWDARKLSIWAIILFPFSIIFIIISFVLKVSKIKFLQKKNSIPIICVGNIYVGGTGKTPLALEIFKIIEMIGKKPAFVKKGGQYLRDEINMLEKVGKTFVSKKNRKNAINSAISENHNVVILDDGFQDFSIEPNFSILCFNSKQLVGNGFIIPSGPLRETLSAVSRSNCIIINGEKNLEFEKKILNYTKEKELHIFYSKYKIKNLDLFQNKKITAFAGIGNPSNFFDLLIENNLNVINTHSFPDHYNYSLTDFDKIIGDNSTTLVTTEKDYCRMTNEQKQKCDYVDVSLEIDNKNKFENLIKSYL